MAFYVTTPIYYVNGTPHVGHAYTTIAADTLTRWKRLAGEDAYFLTGTDEHGQKVLEAAERRGMTPQAHCDDLVVHWKAMMDRLHVRYDRFLRTTDPDHVGLVRRALAHLHEKGEIYRAEYRGWYLVKDEAFVTDKEREERIASGELPESAFRMIEESNWFFRMSKYQERLIAHLRDHPEAIQPEIRRNEVLGFLQKPLGDLCISRPKSRMSWGIELPFDPDFVCYVWFDALLNYVTGAPGFLFGPPPTLGGWPADVQLLGKDILTTHAVYWTTMLMALDLPLPKTLFAHGWWVSQDGQKMSKSLGNVVNPDDVIARYGADAMRLFEMFMGPLESPKPWSTTGVDGVRRFLERVWRLFVDQETDALVVRDEPTSEPVRRALHKATKKVSQDLEGMRFNTAISAMMEFVNVVTPTAERPRETLEPLVLLLAPFAPHLAEELWSRLGHATTLAYAPWPTWDEALIQDSTVTYAVQVNGKLRGQVELAPDVGEAVAIAAAREVENVRRFLEGQVEKKVVFVKGRMVNFVVAAG